MLTKLTVRNFKRFKEVAIDLGNPVVFIGPNNSGKTTALQALALWNIGLGKWNEKRGGKEPPGERPGVTINRRDLISLPVPHANQLWRDLHVRDVKRVPAGGNTKLQTKNIRVDIIVEGVTQGKDWACGLEFDYANEESFYCRPLRMTENAKPQRMPVPKEAAHVRVAFLPPMSGLAASERRVDPGAINVLLGEGRTAEVLRNLCFQITQSEGGPAKWKWLCEKTRALFGVELNSPQYIAERGEIVMTCVNPNRVHLDLSTAGRGLHQTLLLLAHMMVNPGTVLLLDEPDAHLEILRQRETYNLLTEVAAQQDSQVVMASHSEVLLNEAADRDVVVAFVGRPHRIDDRGSQVLKSLRSIGFDQYYQAEQTGWVLYLEGSTDLSILQGFAENLKHPARQDLERPFVRYIEKQPVRGRDHFRGLKEAKPDLVGFLLCDRLPGQQVQPTLEPREYMWSRREIENYVCQPETLLAHAEALVMESRAGPLFEPDRVAKSRQAMEECIRDFVPPVALRDRADRWWHDTKASDEFLDRLFRAFYEKMHLGSLLDKNDYHVLARLVPRELIDPEVGRVLDAIREVSQSAKPAKEQG